MNLKKCLAKYLFFYFLTFLPVAVANNNIEVILKNEKLSNSDLNAVKGILSKNPKETLKSFLSIVKDEKYPDRSRWLSLILIGRAMGKKSAPLMIKYLSHPHWMIRSAAIKSLKSLKVAKPVLEYKKLLTDKSYILREQALETISALKIKSLGLDVLKMLGDQTNYISTKKGRRPSEVVKKVISTLSILKVKESIPMLKKIREKKTYSTLSTHIDEALKKI